MKQGDKIMCKKSMYSSDGRLLLFEVGDIYIIKEFTNVTVTVYFHAAGWTTFIKSISTSIRIAYPDSFEWNKFSDYFYTNIEVRKMKLEKLIKRKLENLDV